MVSSKQVANLLRTAKLVAIILHFQPDGDAVSAAVSLFHVLGPSRVKICSISPIPAIFETIVGQVKVETKLPVSASHYIVVDCPDLKRTGFAAELTKAATKRPIIVIDHHQPGDLQPLTNYYLYNSQASSAAELVAGIIDELRSPIQPVVATALLLGVYTDTGGLQHPNTTSQTLALVARLIRLGAEFDKIRLSFSPKRDLKKLQLWGRILSTITINSLGIAVARVTKTIMIQTQASNDDLLGLAKYLCGVEGTKAALVLTETDQGWRGSLRTKSRTFNVGRLAKLLGGNGGKKVAGFLATEAEISGTIVSESATIPIEQIDN